MATVPMPGLTQGAAANTWILQTPNTAGYITYYNATPSTTHEPDGPGLTRNGTALPAGASYTFTAPFTLRARLLDTTAIPAGSTEDTAQWSVLLDVELPLHQ